MRSETRLGRLDKGEATLTRITTQLPLSSVGRWCHELVIDTIPRDLPGRWQFRRVLPGGTVVELANEKKNGAS